MEPSWSLGSADTSVPEPAERRKSHGAGFWPPTFAPLDPDAVHWYGSADSANLLPEWYMPRRSPRNAGAATEWSSSRWSTTLLVICAMGLCGHVRLSHPGLGLRVRHLVGYPRPRRTLPR